ncbi:MAG: hypothetical protein ACNS62_04890 [Candidatus Cyclobacteriaceae bacterium M3_2C_046]
MFRLYILCSLIWLISWSCETETGREAAGNHQNPESGVRVSDQNPSYWQYQGNMIMLLGGSVEDNLFQIPQLESHLDLLRSVGGNYLRNTMSSRDSGNVWPFEQNESGLYDLNRPNEVYWNRFEHFLQATAERDIIVQIEIWATFDFYRDNWEVNPFNPKNNVNYQERRSKLPLTVDSHPIFTENNFFRSVPNQMNLIQVLEYQQKFVDKLLEHSLKYDHLLYCMDNETSVTAEWGRFWADYIKKVGLEQGKSLQTTEMWDPWDLDHIVHRETFDHPETYTFVDISQNNHNSGDEHWYNGLKQLERLQKITAVRPMNNVKIYGNDGGRHQTTSNAIESFIRNVFFGSASARFHRPNSGQGLNEVAQAVIKSMRSLVDSTMFFQARPDNGLLRDRESNEAFCRALPGQEYAVYFTNAGAVNINLSEMPGATARLRWLDVLNSQWLDSTDLEVQEWTELKTPAPGHWIALISQ